MLFRKRVLVRGKVQGVGFRFATHRHAQKIGGLKGTVKNLSSGEVEILVEGSEREVDDLIAWCYRGSTMSEVNEVVIDSVETIDAFTFQDFNILEND